MSFFTLSFFLHFLTSNNLHTPVSLLYLFLSLDPSLFLSLSLRSDSDDYMSVMSSQIVIRSSSHSPVASVKRHLIFAGTLTTPPQRRTCSNIGEVAGGTTAECVAVCCCCPCVLLEFIIIVVYKVPASICRLILKKRRQKKLNKKSKGIQKSPGSSGRLCYPGYYDEVSDVDFKDFETITVSIDGSDEAIELEKQMWEQFHNAGFWRSQSQRHA